MTAVALQPKVFAVDDEPNIRASLKRVVRRAGLMAETFDSADSFLPVISPESCGCILLDLRMPGMDGLELQKTLREQRIEMPIIFLTGFASVKTAVRAIQAGAYNFLEKPFDDNILVAHVRAACAFDIRRRRAQTPRESIIDRWRQLTGREREVAGLLAYGYTNAMAAQILGVSSQTIEDHRSRIMKKLGIDSIAELVRVTLAI